ncbi:MAG: LexA family transcriptional regulator [Planctomycetota bacterium]
MNTVGQVVRKRREALGLTLSALASSVGVTKGYLSMIENHRVDNPPSRGLLEGLEGALGITPGELLRAADWQVTPEPIKQQVQELREDAGRGRDLAAWLKASTVRKKEGGAGKDLDALYRSGQLSRRVNAVLAESAVPESRADPVTEGHGPDQKQPGQVEAEGFEGFAESAVWGVGVSGKGPLRLDIPGAGVPVRYRVPIINQVAAGHAVEHTDLGYPDGAADRYLDVPEAVDADSFSTVIVGDSMRPRYEPGDVVVCSGSAKVEEGCDCFVRLAPDHESTFKRVYFDAGPGMIRLQPLNPDFPPRIVGREQVSGMYRAVGRYSKL